MNIKDLQGPYKHVFMTNEEVDETLAAMENDVSLKTEPSFVTDGPDSVHLVSFKEKHGAYLKGHPKTNPEHYLSNLRAMIKIRPSK